MKVPDTYKGMKKIKEYPNFVLYENSYGIRECFQYWDLGHIDLEKFKNGYRSAWAG